MRGLQEERGFQSDGDGMRKPPDTLRRARAMRDGVTRAGQRSGRGPDLQSTRTGAKLRGHRVY